MKDIFANLTDAEANALAALLCTTTVQNEMGAENWDLSEEQEGALWPLIHRVEAAAGIVHAPPTPVGKLSIDDILARASGVFGTKDEAEAAFGWGGQDHTK
jgi:hypothetical protein